MPNPSRHLPRRLLAATAALLLAALLPAGTGGCAHYRQGSPTHEQFRSVAVGSFTNDTPDAGLTVHLRQRLAEALTVDGALPLRPADRADLVISGRIVSATTTGIAAVRRAEEIRDENNLDAYRSSAYEAKVTVEFEAGIPGLRRPVIARQSVTGIAEFATLADHATARQEAVRRAAANAAAQIANAVLEGW
ncbi:MAG: LptE family protein [Lentisphaeria bacterium]|jgi:hypothetical protein